jgi:hypothetical protein
VLSLLRTPPRFHTECFLRTTYRVTRDSHIVSMSQRGLPRPRDERYYRRHSPSPGSRTYDRYPFPTHAYDRQTSPGPVRSDNPYFASLEASPAPRYYGEIRRYSPGPVRSSNFILPRWRRHWLLDIMARIVDTYLARMDLRIAVIGLRTVTITLLAVDTALPNIKLALVFVTIGQQTDTMALLSRDLAGIFRTRGHLSLLMLDTLVTNGLAHESVISFLLPTLDDTKTISLVMETALQSSMTTCPFVLVLLCGMHLQAQLAVQTAYLLFITRMTKTWSNLMSLLTMDLPLELFQLLWFPVAHAMKVMAIR